MAVVKCKAGHFYDDTKYSTCPHCSNGLKVMKKEAFEDDLDEERTIAVFHNEPADKINDDREMTIGAYHEVTGNKLLAGWLVAIEGPEKGRDYRIYPGWNKIGRNLDHDIYLGGDRTISRDEEASVIYEPRSSAFYFKGFPGTCIYRNKKKTDTDKLESGDVIEIGESRLVFIPFCTEERKW